MRTKQDKLTLTILIVYTVLILYFLFFGAGRTDVTVGNQDYQINLVPHLISFRFPTFSNLRNFPYGFFELGNFIGFIPFGLLIPRLFRCHFFKFISLFFVSILIIETIQMLTYLGSFDINDAILNSSGAAVGFLAYKIGQRFSRVVWKELVVTALSVIILSVGVIGFSVLLNESFVKQEGPVVALSELESNGDVSTGKNISSFEIGTEKINPEINLYGSGGSLTETFIYEFGGKDIVLSLNYGIPDGVSDNNSKGIIAVNGEEVETYSENGHGTSEIVIDNVNELAITIEGDLKLWDITFREMENWWN